MVAAGLDTLPGNINMTIAYLSSAHGQEIQERLYDEIIKSYPDEDPWHACLIEEKSQFMVSFVKVSVQSSQSASGFGQMTNNATGGASLLVYAQHVLYAPKHQANQLQWCYYPTWYTVLHGKCHILYSRYE